MGQKVHPIGFRLGVSTEHTSKWFAEGKEYPEFLLKDLKVKDFLKKKLSQASVSKITEFIPSFAGLQMETEISALKKVTTEIKKPITCIIGGSKISTKIGIIKNLISKFDNIIIVGGMANNIIKYKGNQIGKSIKEENCDLMIK